MLTFQILRIFIKMDPLSQLMDLSVLLPDLGNFEGCTDEKWFDPAFPPPTIMLSPASARDPLDLREIFMGLTPVRVGRVTFAPWVSDDQCFADHVLDTPRDVEAQSRIRKRPGTPYPEEARRRKRRKLVLAPTTPDKFIDIAEDIEYIYKRARALTPGDCKELPIVLE